MTFLRPALVAGLFALLGLLAAVGALGVLVVTAGPADAGSGSAAAAVHERRGGPGDATAPGVTPPGAVAPTSGRGDALGLVAGGSGLLILASIAGGAWRYQRDPRVVARGH